MILQYPSSSVGLQNPGFSFSEALRDPTVLLLIFSNLLIIFLAVQQSWAVLDLLWIYWAQSLIIGFFSFLKLLTFKGYLDTSVSISPALNQFVTKLFLAVFFAFHYGFFHVVYAIFLSIFSAFSFSFLMSFNFVLAVGVFFINHLFSFLYYYFKPKKDQDISKMVFAPYFRIIPMHLTIIAGGFLLMFNAFILLLVFFMLLKTIADVAMHVFEHADLQAAVKVVAV